MAIRYSDITNKSTVPQSEPLDPSQVINNAGGYVYEIDKWARLQRFLVLGTDGGTYYVKPRELTRANATVVAACLAEDAGRTVQTIIDVSHAGRAPRNDEAIFALAMAASSTDPVARTLALAALPRVCRIPTHLFHFLEYVKGQRGFGRALRRAIAQWYDRWDADQLAFELVKYQQRDGWANRDAFRKAHPKLAPEKQAVLRWAVGAPLDARTVARKVGTTKIVKSYPSVGTLPDVIAAYEELKAVYALDPEFSGNKSKRAVQLITQHGLSREMLPTAALNDVKVWEALLPTMGMTALVRNLAKMTAVALLAPLSEAQKTVCDRLRNPEYLQKGRIHPLAVLNALRVYQSGHGDKGSLTWTPVQSVVDALNDAFYATFGNVTVTGKHLMLALDVSGSMLASIAGTGLSCREASAALALITAAVEPNHAIYGFTAGTGRNAGYAGYYRGVEHAQPISPLKISPKQRLDDVVRYTGSLGFGATDCALPMLEATKRKLDVDAFCIYTDSETWAGSVHPSQALKDYRKAQGKPDAACVVVGMTATGFSIADPKDARMLDVVGFDLATPEAIAAFI